MNIIENNTLGIRPEHIALSQKSGEWEGTVMLAEHLGSDTFLHVDGGRRGTLTVRAPGEFSVGPGGKLWMTPDPARIHRFGKDGRTLAA